MRYLIALVLLHMIILQTYTQISNDWLYNTTGTENERIRSIVATRDGGTLVGGWYDNMITIGDTTYQAEDFSRSGFVIRLDPNGELLWSKEFHSRSFGEMDIFEIVPSTDDGFYLAGSIYISEVDFDPGPDTILSSDPSGDNMMVGKYDENGNYEWATTYVFGSDSDERIFDMDIDAEGNLYGVGYYDNSENGDDDNMTLFSLDSQGEIRWVYVAEPDGRIDGFDGVDVQGEHVYVTGEFQGSGDFDPSESGELIYESFPVESAVVAGKFTLDGELVWMKLVSGENGVLANDIAVTPQGEVYVAGSHYQNTDFDPGEEVENGNATFDNTFSDKPYILKLDTDGNFQCVWTDERLAEIKRLKMDDEGNIFFGGYGSSIFFGQLSANCDDEFLTELIYDESPNSSNANLKSMAVKESKILLGVDYRFGFQYHPSEQMVLETTIDYDFAVAQYDIGMPTQVIAHTIDDDISIFPNPVQDVLNIAWKNTSIAQVEVLDLLGRSLELRSVQGSNIRIPFLHQVGQYYIRLHSFNGEYAVIKVVKP